jgi:hypothetical protein
MWSQTKACIAKLPCVNRRQNRAGLKLTQSSFWVVSITYMFKEAQFFQKVALFPFSGKEVPNLVDPLY